MVYYQERYCCVRSFIERWWQKSPGACFTSSRNNVQICLKGQWRVRPAGNDFSPATLDCVNQLIQRPTEERAQQSVLATSLTRSPWCNISMAVSLRMRFMDYLLHQASFVTGNGCYDRHRLVRLVICFDLAIDQIAPSGLGSLKGIYYSA